MSGAGSLTAQYATPDKLLTRSETRRLYSEAPGTFVDWVLDALEPAPGDVVPWPEECAEGLPGRMREPVGEAIARDGRLRMAKRAGCFVADIAG